MSFIDKFGHGFEAGALRQLQNLQVYIGTWGIVFRRSDLVYCRGYERDGKTYDISNTPQGAHLRLSTPVIHRDDSGKISGGIFASEQEAQWHAKNLVVKGLAKEVRLEPVPHPESRLTRPEVDFTIDPPIRRLALKMCTALAAGVAGWQLRYNGVLQAEPNSPVDDILIMYDHLDALDDLRPPLAHLIYVEAGTLRAYGIVQFFGIIQVYCELPLGIAPAAPVAFVGVLDSITGVEEFRSTSPLQITAPPRTMSPTSILQGIRKWLVAFREQALERGATDPPTLTADVTTNILPHASTEAT
jgi:hypothetical protein